MSGRAGGVLLASRPWRLLRWTTHIVASRTKKREETRRKERSRSTGRSEMKGRGKAKRSEEKGGKRRNHLLLDRFGVPSIVRCVHQPFLPSFLRFFLSFFFLVDRFSIVSSKRELTIMHSLHGRPLRFMSLSPRQCVD